MLLICKKVVYLQNALEILKEESERKLHFWRHRHQVSVCEGGGAVGGAGGWGLG